MSLYILYSIFTLYLSKCFIWKTKHGSKMNAPYLYLKLFWFWEQNEYTLPVPKTLLILIVCSWFPRSRFQPVCRPPQYVFPWAVVPTAEGAVPKYSSRQHRFYCQHLHVARRAGWSVWWPPVFTKHHSWSRRMLIPSVNETVLTDTVYTGAKPCWSSTKTWNVYPHLAIRIINSHLK